jgi:glutamate dehydrogenase (NAD(P)+)
VMVGIPFGGAKSGIVLNPDWTPDERLHALAAMGRAIKPLIEAGYLIGEDMGTSNADINHLHESIGINQAFFALRSSMDRGFEIEVPKDLDPVAFSEMETNLTGIGVMRSALATLEILNIKPENSTVSVQGFGNVGAGAVRHLAEHGVKTIAVADEKGTILNYKGLDLTDLINARDERGVISRDKLKCEFEEANGNKWLEANADIIIPAAIPDAINEKNEQSVKAKAVVEAANIPVTIDAEKSLWKRGVVVVPDFVANSGTAGGLTVFLAGQAPLHPQTIYQVVGDRIADATTRVIKKAKESGTHPREIAEKEADKYLETVKDLSGFQVPSEQQV